jgi:secreted protein with Ig-like and vWFA domain/type II secretory pathway component GspD/PulD (secretin)
LTRDFAGEDRTFRTPNVGEGFYYQHAGGTSNWMGNFTIADGRGEGDGAGKGQANKTADLSRSGLETRTFHVDPNTFYQGLESVGALDFSTFVPKGRTMVAGGGGMGGGGGGGFGGGGAGGRGGGGGLAFVTQTNGSREVQDSVRKFYSAVGVELDPKSGKDVVYNGRTGELTVRGTAQDLETIAAANETLAIAPPEINVKAKFVDEPSAGLPALTPAEGAIARTGVQSGKQSLLGDEPVLGHLFRTQGQAVAGAKPTEPPVTAQNGGESWSASSSLRGFFDDGLNRGAKADSVNLDVARFTNAGTLALNGGVGFQAGLTRDDVGGLRDLYDAKPAGQKQTATTHLIENANAVDVLSALQATVGASSRNSWENPVYSVDAAGYYNLQAPPSTGTPRQTEVIPMKYAKASEIASALNEPGANSTRHSSGAAPFTERTRRSNIVLPSTPNTQVGDATVSADGAGNRVHTDENLLVAQVPRTVVAFDGPLSQTVVGTTLMDVQQQGAGAPKAAGSAADRVHNAAMYYEARKLDEAEAELKSALQKDPNNSTAYNLSRLVQQARNKQAIERQTVTSEKKFAQIEDAWNEPVKRFGLTMTNSLTTSGKTLAKEVAQLDSRTRAMQDKLSNVETQLIKLEYANPSQLADTLRTLMSTNAKVVADERIGQLTVAAKPDDLERIGAVVAELDQPTRQVLIEARSLETETQANLAHIKFATIPNAETRIFQLSYASPAQLAAVLRTLMSTNANVLADVRTSQLVVEGTRNSLRQINEIVYAVDNPGVGMSAENLKKIISAKLAQTATPVASEDQVSPRPATPPPIPQPEVQTTDNAFSTFSLNVSDVSFKLAAASLGKNSLPDPASIRSEEFINAFDYRDPEAAPGAAMAFVSERARYPFAYNRDLLRFSIKTAATGRQAGRRLNLVLLLDNSGSMERADRVNIIHQALRVLASQLQPQDTISVVTFARTARLWVDGLPGNRAGDVAEGLSELTPQGGTNLEDAMNLAYATALRHYLADGINRVVLLTDGAANLGDVDPDTLKQKVEAHRKQGIALDCFGIGWEGYNDDLLEVLSRNGDGRYGFINSPEEASTEFAAQLAGALQVAASDVKVQVEFNPKRVTSYRQIGYAKHQLTKEQFRDNTVDAAEIASQEAGNALYTVEVNPAGEGPLCTVHVRYKIPGTADYREQEWAVPFNGNAVALEQSSPAMRLAATASAFSEWLATSPYAAEVTTDQLLNYLSGVPEIYGADARPKRLEWMIRQAKSVTGK